MTPLTTVLRSACESEVLASSGHDMMCVHSHHHLTSIVRVERSRYRRHARVAKCSKTLESSHSPLASTTRVD